MPNRRELIFQLFLIIVGFAALIYSTANVSFDSGWMAVGTLVVISTAFDSIFPLRLFSKDFTLGYIAVIGCGLLIGPSIIGWAAAIGLVVGYSIQIYRKKRLAPQGLVDILASIGLLVLSLVLAVSLTGWEGMLPTSQSLQAASTGIFFPLIVFVIFHSSFHIIDALIRRAQNHPGYRQDLILFIALELLPIPFVFALVLAYPIIVSWSLVLLAGLPALITLLLRRTQLLQDSSTHLHDRLNQKTEQLEVLSGYTTSVVHSLDVEHILSQACQSAMMISGGQHSAVFLLDLEHGTIQLAQACKLSADFIDRSKLSEIAQDDRAQCLNTGKPDLIPDIQAANINPEYKGLLTSEGIHAVDNFPLISPDGQIGYLSIYYDTRQGIDRERVEYVQSITSQAALAVSNARLHQRTDLALSRRVHQLTILDKVGRELSGAITSGNLFELILNYAMEFTDSTWGLIALSDSKTQCLHTKAQRGYEDVVRSQDLQEGIQGQSFKLQRLLNIRNVEEDQNYVDLTRHQACSHLSVPLVHDTQVLGIISLESARIAAFTNNDEVFVRQLANQAAISVLNSELYHATQNRLHELSTLYLVSTKLAGNLEFSQVLQTIAQAMSAVIDRNHVFIYIWREEARVYEMYNVSPEMFSSRQGLPEQFPDPCPPDLGDGYESLRIAIENAVGEYLYGIYSDGNLLIFPMLVGDVRLGLVVLHSPEAVTISEDEMQLLKAIVAQGAIGLQSALLFTDIMKVRDRLAAVLNSVGEGIVLLEPNGRVVLVNQSLETITGIRVDMMLGKQFDELSSTSLACLGYTTPEVIDLLDKMAGERKTENPKKTIAVTFAGEERRLERTIWPVQGKPDRTIGWMLVFRDITEEQRITQARELITETLIHDLRSPISAVIGSIDVLETEIRSGEQQETDITGQALQIARNGAQRVLGLIESMMDIARMQSGKMELSPGPADLKSMVRGVLNEFIPQSKEYGIILRSEIPTDLPRLCIDQAKIMRVLANLVDNALKYSPSGNQVIISAEAIDPDKVLTKVSDSGPGIPEDFRERIFERFSQVPGLRGRRRGTGLGLAFCKLAIEAHGGQIWVEPNLSGGSDFIFTLPVLHPDVSNLNLTNP